jgi:acetyl esterase
MTEDFVRPDVRHFLDEYNALPGPRTWQVGAVAAREMVRASRSLTDVPVGDLAIIRDGVMPGPGGELPLRLFDARAMREPGPLLLFFHGGGFVFGDIDTHAPFCAEMARRLDLPVVSVGYRLAPEHPFPAGVEDAIAAARWIARSPASIGRDVTGLILAGDSAGGNFTIVASLALRDDPAAVPVIAQWPIYPAADPVTAYPSFKRFAEGYMLDRSGMAWFDQCYAPDPGDWRYAPLLKDQAGMPPTLVLTAGLDPIRDQGRAYAAACAQAGVTTIHREARGNIHGFINLRRAIPSSDADLADCVVALQWLIAEHRQ